MSKKLKVIAIASSSSIAVASVLLSAPGGSFVTSLYDASFAAIASVLGCGIAQGASSLSKLCNQAVGKIILGSDKSQNAEHKMGKAMEKEKDLAEEKELSTPVNEKLATSPKKRSFFVNKLLEKNSINPESEKRR